MNGLRYGFFSFLLLLALQAMGKAPVARNGVLDLRNHSFLKDGSVRLSGEWNFFWKQLHQQLPAQADKQIINLPGLWNGYAWKGEELQGDGFATFHLKVLLPKDMQLFSIDVPYMYTAFKLYIDSMLVCENGNVSGEPDQHISRFQPRLSSFTASPDGEVDILIQISNFEDRKGGIWEVPMISTTEQIVTNHSRRIALEFFVIGALVLFGLYQIGLYFIRKEDRSSLYFGIFCLLMGLHSLFVGSVFIQTLLPSLPWAWMVKLEYLTIYLMPVIFFLFIDALFPGYVKKWVKQFFVGFTLLACLFILATAKKTFGFLLDIMFLPILAMAVVSVGILLKAVRDGKRGSTNALFGVLVFLVFIFNDVLFGLEYINTGNYINFGLLIFVGIQSLNIAYMFSQAFKDVKNLTQHLKLTNASYSRFVPKAFLDFLGKTDINTVELGDQKRADMSMLFVDIRSFTTLSETMSPQDNFDFINSYLSEISPVIRKHGGFVDKYIGDAIMALFPGKPEEAVLASLDILTVLKQYNAKREAKNLPPVRVGMGLNTGTVMLGTVGEQERMETTVISDAVNLASRLEVLAKLYDVQILTTGNTIAHITQPAFAHRVIHRGRVKGKAEMVTLIEVFSEETDSQYQEKMRTKDVYAQAMLAYQKGDMNEALRLFSEVQKRLPSDRATNNYISRCHKFLSDGLPDGWDGVEPLDWRGT
jgi:adenylate cyclase